MPSPVCRPLSFLRDLLHYEGSGGFVLMANAALVLIVANSPIASTYFAVLKNYVAKLSFLSRMQYVPKMRFLMSAALLGLGLVKVAQAEPATEADRASVIAWAKEVLADPYDLRSTEISDRAKVKGVLVLCVAFNGKNLAGRYGGVVRKPFEIKPGGLVSDEHSYRINAATCYAPEITWRPFPELATIERP